MNDLRNVRALINAFKNPAILDTSKDEELVRKMNQRLIIHNRLMEDIENKKYKFVGRQDYSSIRNFPSLTKEDIINITLGCYQLNNEGNYLQDTLSKDNGKLLKIRSVNSNESVLRMKFSSSMSKAKHHYAYIHFSYELSGTEAILGYYCDCQSGARTVGTCSHVTSVLVWLGMSGDNISNVKNHDKFIKDSKRADYDTDTDEEQ